MAECSYKFFSNTKCKYFPCHSGIEKEEFNCIFCFCPLYTMKNCAGNPVFLDSGVKDCSHCPLPHLSTIGYDIILKALKEMDVK